MRTVFYLIFVFPVHPSIRAIVKLGEWLFPRIVVDFSLSCVQWVAQVSGEDNINNDSVGWKCGSLPALPTLFFPKEYSPLTAPAA